ncbi:MAG: GGDEF domain-containing protein, partial [Comamonas sp.]|nr:GGDEF domain-containing protein [Comamonas sp.]
MTPPNAPSPPPRARLLWGPEVSSPLHTDTAQQERWRKRTWQLHISVLLSHVYAFALLLGHCWAGYADWSAVLWYGLWVVAG